jgi:hypothetical protein
MFKYSIDGLDYSAKSFPDVNKAAVGAYLSGSIGETDILSGVNVYIGQVFPISLRLDINTLITDIQNDLSEFAIGRLNITHADKQLLSTMIQDFILERNPNLSEIRCIGQIHVNKRYLENFLQENART